MDANLFCKVVYQTPVHVPVQSPKKLWMYVHSPQRMEEFKQYYGQICNEDGLVELQRFILLTRQFTTTLNELELVQLFDFFDLFRIQQLDCQSLYILYDLLLSNALQCRQLFLFNYQTLLIPYLQDEQNSLSVLKSKLFQLLFLMNISSRQIFEWSAMVEDCVSQVEIRQAIGFVYKCVRGAEGELR